MHQKKNREIFVKRIERLLTFPNLNLDITNEFGFSALHYAVMIKTESKDIIIMLLQRGASSTALYNCNLKTEKNITTCDNFMSKNKNKLAKEKIDVINRWHIYLPEWSRKTHYMFPKQVRDQIKTWMLMCYRLKLNNTIGKHVTHDYIIRFIVTAFRNFIADIV